MDIVLLLARLALAAVFLVAGGAKLADLPGSRKAVTGFGVPERFAPAAGLALPIAELVIGLALVPTGSARWAALAALALLLVFIGAISYNLAQGRTPDCHCFGQIHSEPAGPSTLVRNGILAAVALFILVAGWGDPGASAVAWLGDLAAVDIVLLVGGLAILGLVGLLGWAIVNLMSQNGRLLTRLDALEASIAAGGGAAVPPASPPEPTLGLPVGSPAPGFALPDALTASAAPVTLDALRAPGRPVMLLFTDPGCGPCNLVLRELSRWREAAGQRLDLVVISRGAREANLAKAREHGLDRVLLQQSREVAEAYGAQGTPAAVIVRPDGTIATPLAGGLEAIRALVVATLGAAAPAAPAPKSQPMPGPAPDFRLPDLDGKPVALADLRRASVPTLLFFTDPRCGPCQELLPEVARWERDYGDRLAVTVIGNGEAAANREHTARHGFARVLVQRDMDAAIPYGIAQLPAAVVIGTDGAWNGKPAFGEGAIRHLVATTANAPELNPPPRPVQPSGPAIAIGELTPSIVLPNLDGALVDLADTFRNDRDTVLLFWNPGCGFCQRMIDDLKTWESQRSDDSPGQPALIVISAGSAEGTRAHGFASTVLLDDGRGVGRQFGAQGTPAAIRIDRDGRVASPIAAGATAAFGLLRAAAPASANGQLPA